MLPYVLFAQHFAAQVHGDEKRLDGSLYFNHVLRVYSTLKNLEYSQPISEPVLSAAILHDVLETGHVQLELLGRLFGAEVANMVCALSKYPKSYFEEEENAGQVRLEVYVTEIKKYACEKQEILLIKMSDQIDNIASLGVFPPEKQQKQLREVEDYFMPIYEEYRHKVRDDLKESYECLYLWLQEIIQTASKDLKKPLVV